MKEQVKINAIKLVRIAERAELNGGYFDSKPDIYGHYSSLFIDFKAKKYFILPPYTNNNFAALNKKFEFLGDLKNSERDIKAIARGLVTYWDYKEEKSPLTNKKYIWTY